MKIVRKIMKLTMSLLSLQTILYAAQEVNTSFNHEKFIENTVAMYPQYVEGFQVLGLGDDAFENFLHDNLPDDENEDEEAHGGEILESAMDIIKNGIQETFMKALQEHNPDFIHNLKLKNIHTMADLSPLTPLATMKNLTDPKIRYAMKYSDYNPDDTVRPFMLPQIKEWIREWLVRTPDPAGCQTLLCKAVSRGDQKLMKLLISAGSNINEKKLSGYTLLHNAIGSSGFIGAGKSIETIKILLDAGANPNIQSDNGMTPLMYSIEWIKFRNFDMVQILLAANSNPNIQDNTGNTSLILAVQKNKLSIIKILLAAHANPNIQNNIGVTALHYAPNMSEIRALLLQYQDGAH